MVDVGLLDTVLHRLAIDEPKPTRRRSAGHRSEFPELLGVRGRNSDTCPRAPSTAHN